MEKLLLVLCIVAATSVIAQDLSPYHYIIKGIVKKNFKSITEQKEISKKWTDKPRQKKHQLVTAPTQKAGFRVPKTVLW